MDKYKENILAAVIFIGLLSHYVIGYFLWDKLGSEKLYSITAYFCMDIWGFIVYLLANSKALKGMGALGMVLGSYFFYMEFNDPNFWNLRDYLTLGLVVLNCGFIWMFTDKIKYKNKS